MLLRAGYGIPATYGCVVLLAVFIALGVHNGGGAMAVTNALYFPLLVGVALVLDDPLAIDVTVAVCLLCYLGLALYEASVAPPAARAFQGLLANSSPLAIASIMAGMPLALIGCWLVMRATVSGLRRSTSALERARADAEARADENAALAVQVQAGNDSLMATEARLRDTIEALSLPLIPLRDGVVLVPLVGYLDDMRATQMLDGLLRGIYDQRAHIVVVDITGLRDIDARVAAALLHAAGAARLLGAQTLLSGVSPRAAQMLVDLGEDMTHLSTAASLGDALRLIERQDQNLCN
jgi:anti-anti-sigma regulatory factor